MKMYSVKMRAAGREDGETRHVSGAESLIPEDRIIPTCESLLNRAANHARGRADEIYIKIERVEPSDILYLKALPVTTVETASAAEGRREALEVLRKLDLRDPQAVFDKMEEAFGMRGAMLLNVDTLERLEPDPDRGVRVTRMDADVPAAKETKNHFREALILATKAAHGPGIAGEICISDDPDYVTGYVASQKLGYIRFTKLKEPGDPRGGRILLYRGADKDLAECIHYLQKRPVLVTDIPECPAEGEKWAELKRILDEKKARHLYRSIPEMQSPQSPHIRCQNRDMLLFASNNYLDLAVDKRLAAYAAQMTEKYGAGAGGSRLTTGSTPLHSRLERALAEWKGAEAALLFNTGYMANLGTISALCSKEWVIFSDEKNHASIIDGCRLSKAHIVIYKHNDMDDLDGKARRYRGRRGLIVSDSVFSMDGDIVNLPGLMETANRYGMYSMIDEAHATGVVGESGRGVTELFHLKPDIIVGTCSKALGSEGGFVCGNAVFIDFLINHARSFIFSTALPPGVIAASMKALEIIQNEPQRIFNLRDNVRFFCSRLGEYGIEAASGTAIVPIIIGEEEKAVAVSDRLRAEGFYIPAIRYPTVPEGRAMLRAVLMSSHSRDELEAAARAIAQAIARA